MTDRSAVRDTFDRIAAHFSATREYAWPEVTSFLEGRRGGVGLDLGCGNGRHAEPLAECVDRTLGLDASRPLLDIAVDRADDRGVAVEWLQGDTVRLPLPDDSVDLAVYVATIHHLPTRQGRVESLRELARVLAPGGVALVSAWSTAHERFEETEGFDTEVDWKLPRGETVGRFYHIYDPEEFDRDLLDGGLRIRDSRVSSGNCYAVVDLGGD